MTPDDFRGEFPALETLAWLDTPGAPPGAMRVTSALHRALDDWRSGDFAWEDWDGAAHRARAAFGTWLGVPAERVTTLGSLAEAAATVARTRLPGEVVLADDEFQSLLLPFTAEADRDPARTVALARSEPGQSRTEALCDRIGPRTTLVAVSETTTRDGERLDLVALRRRADDVGARLFVNGTQSLGVLRPRLDEVRPDYYAVHGYKWMLSPRGAAWLYAAPGTDPLSSIAPNWKTATGGDGLFGGAQMRPGSPGASDTSPAWFSWIGAEAALALLAEVDPAAVERRALELADRFDAEALASGALPVRRGEGSHIRVVRVARPEELRVELARSGVRARVTGDRLRIGMHGFNSHADVDRALGALRRAQRAEPSG